MDSSSSGQMKTPDVFVLPSAKKNSGIAAVESMTAGIPTIVSAGVGSSSDTRSHDAGLIVKRDPSQLASAIGDLLENKEKAATLATNGRRLVRERAAPANRREGVVRALSGGHFQKMS